MGAANLDIGESHVLASTVQSQRHVDVMGGDSVIDEATDGGSKVGRCGYTDII